MNIQLESSALPAWTRSTTPYIRRYYRPLLLAVIVILGISYIAHPKYPKPDPNVAYFRSNASSSHPSPTSADAKEFWDILSIAIAKGKPAFDEVKLPDDKQPPWLSYNKLKPNERPSDVKMTVDEVDDMKRAHKTMVKDARTLASQIPFVKGTRGIVMSAGNDALTTLTTSLRMLRMSGSRLPVEIFIDIYEEKPCKEIFPSLGARCVFVEDYLPKNMENPLKFGHFSFKPGSILFSTFEQVLHLDSDLFPIMNPDFLFTTEPFTSHGLVLWPDYWDNTASPLFYDIAGLPVPAMGTRASTESGAIFFNKNTHAEALFLTTFYNLYGPNYYYPLLSQGSMGKGDKETWLPAAHVFDLPVYQVIDPPGHLGYRCDGRMRGIASAQHHPLDDFIITSNGHSRANDQWLEDMPSPRTLFIHGNLPKYDAPGILEWWLPEGDWIDMLRCDANRGSAHRLWGPKDFTIAKFGWDAEKAVWDSMRWVACEHEKDYSMWVNGTWHSDPKVDVCKRIVEFYEELLPDEKYEKDIPVGGHPDIPNRDQRPHWHNWRI